MQCIQKPWPTFRLTFNKVDKVDIIYSLSAVELFSHTLSVSSHSQLASLCFHLLQKSFHVQILCLCRFLLCFYFLSPSFWLSYLTVSPRSLFLYMLIYWHCGAVKCSKRGQPQLHVAACFLFPRAQVQSVRHTTMTVMAKDMISMAI